MEMKNFEGAWLIAVSGGSDSMALLDMCVKRNIKVGVAHVNYKKRESADRDMEGVRRYCLLHDIPFYLYVVSEYSKENFQAQAREIRYSFFKQLIKRYGYSGVLVAHHKDDVIETYLMQKQRGGIPAYYGISSHVRMMGMQVYRPLLGFTKKELEDYCERNNIAYYLDESNEENNYLRNRIRHEQVELMCEKEKNEIIDEIDKKNQQHQMRIDKIRGVVEKYDEEMFLEDFLCLDKDMQYGVLREFIVRATKYYQMKEKNIEVLVRMLCDKTGNFKHNINGEYDLYCEYGKIGVSMKKSESFEYIYHKVETDVTPYFSICTKGEVIEGVSLSEKDFPITIRNARDGDKIRMRFGTKRVSRFLIDRKISHKQRRLWPVVVNCEGNVVFVCGMGCDIEHYSNNSTMFVLK